MQPNPPPPPPNTHTFSSCQNSRWLLASISNSLKTVGLMELCCVSFGSGFQAFYFDVTPSSLSDQHGSNVCPLFELLPFGYIFQKFIHYFQDIFPLTSDLLIHYLQLFKPCIHYILLYNYFEFLAFLLTTFNAVPVAKHDFELLQLTPSPYCSCLVVSPLQILKQKTEKLRIMFSLTI